MLIDYLREHYVIAAFYGQRSTYVIIISRCTRLRFICGARTSGSSFSAALN